MPRQTVYQLHPFGWQNDPEEERTKYPSIDDIERANYSAVVLGNLETWSVPPMTYGEKPEAHPDNHPVVSAFQANFVRGGLVFNMHHHHYANDVMGWSGFAHQLAENCKAALTNAAFPAWDPICLDLSRLNKQEMADEVKVDGPPLSTLASYVRQMTNSVTQENLDKTLDMVAMVRDKTNLNIRIDSHPPMSILQTDHRDANIVSAEFGFAAPLTYRHLLDRVTEGVVIIYPTRNKDPESDEGPEFSIAYEKHLAHDLINDAEFRRYFEYRGVDAENAGSITAPPEELVAST